MDSPILRQAVLGYMRKPTKHSVDSPILRQVVLGYMRKLAKLEPVS